MDSASFAGIDPKVSSRGAVVLCRDPFDWSRNEVHPITPGVPLGLLAKAYELDPFQSPVVAHLNDRWVLQAEWDQTFVDEHSVATFVSLPLGGSGNDLLRNILLLAVVVAATVVTAGAAGAILGASFAAGTLGAAALGAAVAIGGAALINAVIPPQPPALGDFSGSPSAGGGFSPSYSVQAAGNTARLGQPIPVLYGRHIIYPDYFFLPYYNYENNDQYLNAVLVIGQGTYTIESVRIGDTGIDNFREIDYEIRQPGQGPTIISGAAVYSSPLVAGQTLRAENEDDADWVGPFPACNANTTIDRIFVDIAFPQGLYEADEDGVLEAANVTWRVQARRINALGQPISSFVTLGDEEKTAQETKTLRFSFSYDVTPARWEVRVIRTNNAVLDRTAVSTANWIGLRGRTVQTLDFTGITTLVIRARATDNLNNVSSRQVNVIATRRLRLSSSGGFFGSPVATRQIGAAVADMLCNTSYGGGLPEDRIDWVGLTALDALWAGRGDWFDGIFDTPTTVWDAVNRALRCGRAKAYMQAGTVRFHRDAPQTLPVAMFGKGNISPGSFKLTFLTHIDGETADGVEAEYFNSVIWQPLTVTASANGGTPSNPVQEQLFGVTNANHAAREAAYMAAANRYRRVFATWETELDGLIPSMGDLVLVANDFPRWGLSGYVTEFDPDSLVMTLSEDPVFTDGETYVMRLRGADGTVSQPVEITEGVLEHRVILANHPLNQDGSDFEVWLPDDRVPTLFQIGTESAAVREVIVTSIMPRGKTVQIDAVVEDSRVHVN